MSDGRDTNAMKVEGSKEDVADDDEGDGGDDTSYSDASTAASGSVTGKRKSDHTRQSYLQNMQTFWQRQMHLIQQTDIKRIKQHELPLARIKKIMKSDEDVRMISAEAPILFAKACELFILDLSMRAWSHTDENKRRTLQRSDVAEAVSQSDLFDFLVDIIPKEDTPQTETPEKSRKNSTQEVGSSSGDPMDDREHPHSAASSSSSSRESKASASATDTAGSSVVSDTTATGSRAGSLARDGTSNEDAEASTEGRRRKVKGE